MKVTVITVCLNAVDSIKETLDSVLEQKDCNYEYIIKDGGSNDGTQDIVSEYDVLFRKKGHRLVFHVKKDAGIYDAMNQALNLCDDTDYVIFMNSGDKFYNSFVLADLAKRKYQEEVLIGLTCVKLKKRMIIAPPKIKQNMFSFYHQSVFVRTQTMKTYMFDTNYLIAADRDALLRMRRDGLRMVAINMVVSIYDTMGFSAQHIDKTARECRQIEEKYGASHKRYKRLMWKLRALCYRVTPFFENLNTVRNVINSGDI